MATSNRVTGRSKPYRLILIVTALLLIACVKHGIGQTSFEYPSIETIREKIGPWQTADLWTVGIFIAAHKYFGADLRFQSGTITDEDRVFYKKFPTPVLKTFHPDVKKACEQGPMDCIEEVAETAFKSGSLKYFFNDPNRTSFEPFKTKFEMFQYRQTASYYLCWYTMRRSKVLQYTNREQTCLADLAGVSDIPKDTRETLLEDKADAIADSRGNIEYYAPEIGESKPFVCPQLWFCPDPCYGRESHGSYIISNHTQDQGNPCKELKNNTCVWNYRINQNFDDLIKNKFNISCNCNEEFPGFEWNNEYELCVDKDECYDGTAECQGNRVCRNTVGSYFCTCQRGYEVNKKTDECEKSLALHKSAKILKYKPKVKDLEEGDFIDDLMSFFGLSAGHAGKASVHIALFMVFLLLTFI